MTLVATSVLHFATPKPFDSIVPRVLRRPLGLRALAWGRLPLQLPLIAWALRASRDLRSDSRVPRVPAGS